MEHAEESPGLQILSRQGGISYVHQNAIRRVVVDTPPMQGGEAPEDEGEACQAVPPGCAVEFGTWRLVPIQYTPNGTQVYLSRDP